MKSDDFEMLPQIFLNTLNKSDVSVDRIQPAASAPTPVTVGWLIPCVTPTARGVLMASGRLLPGEPVDGVKPGVLPGADRPP